MNHSRSSHINFYSTENYEERLCRWAVELGGVVPASEHQEILIALASLIRAQRYEMALTILDNELGR